jgi:hypothetical protein
MLTQIQIRVIGVNVADFCVMVVNKAVLLVEVITAEKK